MPMAGMMSVQWRILRTLVDIGPRRLQRRLRYDLRQRLDRHLPVQLASAWAGCYAATPHWLPGFQGLARNGLPAPPPPIEPAPPILFSFLNQERALPWPIQWNNPSWPRLWQFHLHYFDWAREWLDQALSTGLWPGEAWALEPLLDHWIAANSAGRGDGWHSYTLSLRTRNWIWLLCCCPALATPERLHSLWQQLCWLQAHPEHCHGGNHWLENLTALALGGLQFSGPQAQAMHRRALGLLQRELASQVLADGGHEERSASYHLLMLDRLVELACALTIANSERPAWLLDAIEAMAAWAVAIRLEGGRTPRFNDSAADAASPLDEVVAFAQAALERKPAIPTDSAPQGGLRCRLLQAAAVEPALPTPTSIARPLQAAAVVTDLPATGWTLLRPGHGWELAFKCGVPCPLHLPSHVHSDQLSVELSHHGRWLLSEAGTSIYGHGPERAYERSGAAHNVLQLGVPSAAGGITWIEPVEVWGGFRAGRKAQPRERHCGDLAHGGCFTEGSHDGFDRVGASHHRRVELTNPAPRQITLKLQDTVITRVPLRFRIWWHLAPLIPEDLLAALVLSAPTAQQLEASWHSTCFAEGFGQRLPRQSYCLSGALPPGEHQLQSVLPIALPPLQIPQACPASG
jgi:uncharacterized heparinase superfamily protein